VGAEVRGLISFVVVAVAVVCQLTVVDRIAFPGGSAPDLVLLVVAALALASGPLTGTLTGFLAGLALDAAPPGSHFVGQDALVFCLIGYACGLLADDSSDDAATEVGHTALFEIVVTAAGAICGEALVALLGVMLSDPRVTWPAITHVLPAAVAYDVLLCPFVLYACAAALRLAGARREGQRAGWSPARAVPHAGLGAVRQLGGGSTPRLRLSDGGKSGAMGGMGARGGMRGPGAGGRAAAKREPRLKVGRAGSRSRAGAMTGSRAGLGAAFAPGGLGGGSAKVRFGRSHLGRSWLGGSVFTRSSSGPGMSSPLGRSSAFGRPRLTRALRGSAQQKSPGRGWLRRQPGAMRGSAMRGSAMRGSAFRPSGKSRRWAGATTPRLRPGRSGPVRLHMPRPKSRRRWRTGGYR
jgi:rod shape-determining protein MreD